MKEALAQAKNTMDPKLHSVLANSLASGHVEVDASDKNNDDESKGNDDGSEHSWSRAAGDGCSTLNSTN